tara:strand:+ start:152 stop:484 length:333 start_codon:yes stop_codon:yes gene_type:complete
MRNNDTNNESRNQMSKFNKPLAPQRIDLATTGTITPAGVVLLSKLGRLNFDYEVIVDGQRTKELRGELRIVRLTFGHDKFEVQMNGHSIYNGKSHSRFYTLAEAADWAGF